MFVCSIKTSHQMHRHHRFYTTALVLLLFAFHMAKAKELSIVPLKIDTTKSSDDSSGTCNRICANETQILAIGQLLSTFVIVTTDLFIFELPENAVTSVVKPYQVLVNEKPNHMRDRFPRSYSALKRISGRILYAVTMAINGEHVHEYIVFTYSNSSRLQCLLSIDVREDKAIFGPCDDWFYIVQAISYPPGMTLEAKYLWYDMDDDISMVICPQDTKLIMSIDDEKENNENPCLSMEDCSFVGVIQPRDVDTRELISSVCINISSERIVSGFFPKVLKMHLIDNNHVVHTFENIQMSQVFVETPLTDFIGCNIKIPNSVQLTNLQIGMIIAIFVVVQLAIAVVIFFALRGTDETANEAAKCKRKSQKGTKSDKSISSKSRRSISAVESSKSRKSRTSVSRSVARDSSSPGSPSALKPRSSRLSRGSSKKNTSNKVS